MLSMAVRGELSIRLGILYLKNRHSIWNVDEREREQEWNYGIQRIPD